jgi:hypothetical protein
MMTTGGFSRNGPPATSKSVAAHNRSKLDFDSPGGLVAGPHARKTFATEAAGRPQDAADERTRAAEIAALNGLQLCRPCGGVHNFEALLSHNAAVRA